MPRLKESTKLERREQIAAAAMRCFSRDGLSGTSMADIIAESNMSAGSIYSHFASKAELMRFVAAGFLEHYEVMIGEVPAENTAPSPGTIFGLLRKDAAVNRERARLLLQMWGAAARDPDFGALALESMTRLRILLVAGLGPWAAGQAAATGLEANVLAERAASAILAAMQGYNVRIALDPSVDPQQLLTELGEALG